jgi:hypothetical protein
MLKVSRVGGVFLWGVCCALSFGCELVAAPDRTKIDGCPGAPECADGDAGGATCGDGKVDPGEACDDGASNGATPCGCQKTCQFASAGTACADTNLCNGAEQCDGKGACASPGPLSCDDGKAETSDFCVAAVGCGHLAFSAGTNTAVRGNELGGTEYVDACPAGKVLVGLNAKIGASFDQVQAVCAPVVIDAAAAVTFGAPETPFPFRGSNNGTDASAMCPANQMVIGFVGRAGALVDQVSLRCAPVVVNESSGAYAVKLGAITTGMPVGGTGGVAFADTDCATGSVATGAYIRAGGSVDALGLLCGVPAVTK